MDLFDVLNLIGGLCLFLFGMTVMGDSLERRAGGSLKMLLGKLTGNKAAGFLTGMGVTAVIQSSSATTVMVVGFVNSGIMSLTQAINVIMGANVGTTVTAWVLSLGGIDSSNVIVQLFKPTSFTPVLALIGTAMLMFGKTNKKKDTGMILLGFATLMFGMDTMSASVKGLADIPAFQQMFIMFKNPILGVMAGAVLTAIIQSSSASVGILQALAVTGQVSYGAAIPIIMGQNIGTCITAVLSSFGTNKNAKRAAMVHLFFNIIGTVIWLTVFTLISYALSPAILGESANLVGIAVCHSAFNILCTIVLLPMSKLLEKIAMKLVPEDKKDDKVAELDERLLTAPAVAIARCETLATEMLNCSMNALECSINQLFAYDSKEAEEIRKAEEKGDHYEDILGSYLVKLSHQNLDETLGMQSVKLLKVIGDFERISDHSVNIVESAEELKEKDIVFTPEAKKEITTLCNAVKEIAHLSSKAFMENDINAAKKVEPLEQVIDELKEKLRTNHILRLQKAECTAEAGFVWSDLLTNLERTSDHCSNIAASVIDSAKNSMNTHEILKETRRNSETFMKRVEEYSLKYSI